MLATSDAMALTAAYVQPANAAGSVVTIPGSLSIIGRAGGIGTTLREVGRERVTLEIVVLAPSDALRNAVGGAIEPGIRSLRRLRLADQSIAMIWFGEVDDNDDAAKSDIYRRTLRLSAEYASTIVSTAAQILSFVENVRQIHNIAGPLTHRLS